MESLFFLGQILSSSRVGCRHGYQAREAGEVSIYMVASDTGLAISSAASDMAILRSSAAIRGSGQIFGSCWYWPRKFIFSTQSWACRRSSAAYLSILGLLCTPIYTPMTSCYEGHLHTIHQINRPHIRSTDTDIYNVGRSSE